MNIQRDWVSVGDSNAKLHLLDLKNDFELVKSYSTEYTRITGVHMTEGFLITVGYMDCIKFLSLTDPPQLSFKWCRASYIPRVSITRIYRKKKDFDEVLENVAKSTSKKLILFIIKIGKNGFAEASKNMK